MGIRLAVKKPDWNKQIKLGDMIQVDDQLWLGALSGNRFSIALWFVQTDASILESNVENIEKNGFINYFGLQRFGTYSIKTHEIGMYVLREDWKQVCWMIIESASSASDRERKKLIATYVFDQDEILKGKEMLTFRDWLEETILDSLLDSTNGYKNAFEKLPRNTRILYVHAY